MAEETKTDETKTDETKSTETKTEDTKTDTKTEDKSGTTSTSSSQEEDGLPTDPAELKKLTTQLLKDKRDANKEAQDTKAKLKKLEEAEETRKLSELSEIDQLKTKLVKQEEEAKTAKVKAFNANVKAEATSLGFADPGDAVRFVDSSLMDEDESKVTKALEQLAKDKPYLLKGDGTTERKKGLPSTKSGNPGGGTDKKGEEVESSKSRFQTVKNLGRLQRN